MMLQSVAFDSDKQQQSADSVPTSMMIDIGIFCNLLHQPLFCINIGTLLLSIVRLHHSCS